MVKKKVSGHKWVNVHAGSTSLSQEVQTCLLSTPGIFVCPNNSMAVGWLIGWLDVCCFTSTETIYLLGTGAQDGHLDFHTAPELWVYS